MNELVSMLLMTVFECATKAISTDKMIVLIVVVIVAFVVGSAGGYFIYTRLINKNANPKNRRRK